MLNWPTLPVFPSPADLLILLAYIALVSLTLLRTRPQDRSTLINTLLFLGLSLAGMLAGNLLAEQGLKQLGAQVGEFFLLTEGMALIRLSGLFIFRVLLPLAKLSPPSILEDILVIIAYVVWGIIRLYASGVDLSGIVATSAVITAVVAFSMQDTLGNILGGVVLELDNSLDIGDWIRINDVVGKVVDIRWRSTSIETRNWETVVIPNSVLMKTQFMVLGKRTGEPLQWRRWIYFTVDYHIPPVRVTEIVEGAIQTADIPGVAKTPAVSCVMMDFDSYAGKYALRYWLTDLEHDDGTDSLVRSHVFTALARAGIRIPLQEHRLHIYKENEEREQKRHSRELIQRIDALRQTDLFKLFSENELHAVAEKLKYAPFSKGSIITKQGAVAHWLYILISGDADVVVESPDGSSEITGQLQAGQFFGEMGLMTGAPRTATVIARNEVECYRLDKSDFEQLLHSRPTMAEEISHILVQRRSALDVTLQSLDAHSRDAQIARQNTELLARIRHFFGLA